MITLGTVYAGDKFSEVWMSDVNNKWYVTFGRINTFKDSVYVGNEQQAIEWAVQYLARSDWQAPRHI